MIELPKLDIPSMSSEERIKLASLFCLQAMELLDGVERFEWKIGDGVDYENDGQPDDYQENSDFANDDYFDNMEATDDGFWS